MPRGFPSPWLGPMHNKQTLIVIVAENKKCIRNNPQNVEVAEAEGDFGKFAWYTPAFSKEGTVRFKSPMKGFLRILDDGKVDNNGGMGEYTSFELKYLAPGKYKIKSVKVGRFLCYDGGLTSTEDEGQSGTTFMIYGRDGPQLGFPWWGKNVGIETMVVIQGRHGGSLRNLSQEEPDRLATNGSFWVFAWYFTLWDGDKCRFKSNFGNYLRINSADDVDNKGGLGGRSLFKVIDKGNGHFQLQSAANSLYLCVDQDGNAKGVENPEDPGTVFQIWGPLRPPSMISKEEKEQPAQEDEKDLEEAQVEPDEDEKEADQKQPQIEKDQTHPQPLPDPKPSIKGREEFNEDIAKSEAEMLRKAMKGFGTDEKKIVKVTIRNNRQQRLAIREAYSKLFDRDLIKDLKSELGGHIERLLVSFYLPEGAFDAEIARDAMEGLGFNAEQLIEVLCTRTNEQLKAMKEQWDRMYKGDNLVMRVTDETKKMIGHNSFRNLLLTILKAERPCCGPVNTDVATLDAQLLTKFLKKSDIRCKRKFLDIFTTRSWTQIAEISRQFQDVSKSYNLSAAIRKKFGNSDTAHALMVIEDFCLQPYDFWAKKLVESMKGVGTKENLLIRVLATRAEIDLDSISLVFSQRYGEGKTLAAWLKSDLGGDLEMACVSIATGELNK